MMHTEFEFSEVPVLMPNGAKLFVSGAFNISYTIQPDDPDVGLFSAYPEFDIEDDWVTLRAFDERDYLDGEDMTIRLPWLPRTYPCNSDPLGQIFKACDDAISNHIMEIEDGE